MAIQIRRGSYEDFNPSKLVAGELAVVTEGDPSSSTGRALYICFEPGAVKRIVDYDDIGDEIAQAAGIQIDDLRDVVADAESATMAAKTAAQNANTAAEAASQAAGWDISNKTVNFTTPSTPTDLSSGDSLATLIGKLQAYINTRSYVGMIIHSTTLATAEDVKAIYGGTTWIQHSGYFLYGASFGVTANHAAADGGEANHTLTVAEIPSHRHGLINKLQPPSYEYGCVAAPGSVSNSSIGGAGETQYTDYAGGGQAHNNMPPYKNVYIWERTQ